MHCSAPSFPPGYQDRYGYSSIPLSFLLINTFYEWVRDGERGGEGGRGKEGKKEGEEGKGGRQGGRERGLLEHNKI